MTLSTSEATLRVTHSPEVFSQSLMLLLGDCLPGAPLGLVASRHPFLLPTSDVLVGGLGSAAQRFFSAVALILVRLLNSWHSTFSVASSCACDAPSAVPPTTLPCSRSDSSCILLRSNDWSCCWISVILNFSWFSCRMA